jgi:hypothetical protein
MLSVYEGRMIDRARHIRHRARLGAVAALLGLGFALCGCAEMSDSMTSAFADPAKYDLYDCKQLEPERKSLATRAAELQGLMAKAETGAAGSLVSELAYRNDYIAVRGQAKLAEEAWRRNKCHESPPEKTGTPDKPGAPSANAKPAPPSRSGTAVY